MKAAFILAAAVLLSGCAAEPANPPGTLTPDEAINLAAQAAPKPVPVLVAVHIISVQRGGGNGAVFLNSAMNYGDPHNLAIRVPPQALPALEAKFGGPLDKTLWNRRVRVKGQALRFTGWIHDQADKRIGKMFYQTHIRVDDPAQIDLL